MNYKIRYTWLWSLDIENRCHPYTLGPDAQEARIQLLNSKAEFYEKLEHSILEEGIQFPLCVVAKNQALYTEKLGGSRLLIAQKHGLCVPCLISDFDDRFSELEALPRSLSYVGKFFQDRHYRMTFSPRGLYVEALPHLHLGDTDWRDRKTKWRF